MGVDCVSVFFGSFSKFLPKSKGAASVKVSSSLTKVAS